MISMIAKSTSMVNLLTCTSMLSTIPRGNLMEQSDSCIIMCVDFIATFPILFSRDNVISVMVGKCILRLGDEEITFDVRKAMKHPQG